MRIAVTNEEFQAFKNFYSQLEMPNKEKSVLNRLLIKMIYENNKDVSSKKQRAVAKATQKRSRVAKDKIVNAINILRFEGRPLSIGAVAKEAGVSFNTVKKYREYLGQTNF